jgi:hypothetical protein
VTDEAGVLLVRIVLVDLTSEARHTQQADGKECQCAGGKRGSTALKWHQVNYSWTVRLARCAGNVREPSKQMLRKMFWCAVMFCMLFSKNSKQTRKKAEETAAAPEMANAAEAPKQRANRSSKSKSSETSETGSTKHRKASTKSVASAQPTPAKSAAEPKAMAAAVGVLEDGQATAVEPVATLPQTETPLLSNDTATPEEIAALAYSYWVQRGYAPGSPEQDWLRAERELNLVRG